jgi:hypothetical protein
MRWTADQEERFLQAIKMGNFRKPAAQYAGLDWKRVEQWLYFGDPTSAKYAGPETRYAKLYTAVRQAESEAEVRGVAKILRAGEDDPKHLQWWLERKFPGRWSGRQTVDVTVKPGNPVEALDLAQLTDEELEVWARLFRKAKKNYTEALSAMQGQPLALPPGESEG